jgi:hypothetical protein
MKKYFFKNKTTGTTAIGGKIPLIFPKTSSNLHLTGKPPPFLLIRHHPLIPSNLIATSGQTIFCMANIIPKEETR